MSNVVTKASATTTASATLPFMTLMGAAGHRLEIYEIAIGSSADASNAATWDLQRCTTAGTPGSSLTPVTINPADGAVIATAGLAVFSPGPTLTAGAFVWPRAINQRQSFQWQAAPGKEIIIPATAANGAAMMNLVVSAGFAAVVAICHVE